jgi:hypothetical protein
MSIGTDSAHKVTTYRRRRCGDAPRSWKAALSLNVPGFVDFTGSSPLSRELVTQRLRAEIYILAAAPKTEPLR